MPESAGAFTNDAKIDAASPKVASLSLIQRIVAWSAAILLLTAAVLKAWPMATGQAFDTQVASLGKLVLIQGEILLALWLISGINAAWAFRAAIVFFAGAALVNLRSIWLGEVSCGCFGKLDVPPLVSLGVTCLILTVLLGLRPLMRNYPRNQWTASHKSAICILSTCSLIIALGAMSAIAKMYFRPIVIDAPKEINLGRLAAGQTKTTTVTLTNRSALPVNVIGASTSCTCSTVTGLPVKIQPGQSLDIELNIRLTGREKPEGRVLFYSDHSDAAQILVNYKGYL